MGKATKSKLLRKEAIRPNPVGIPSVRSVQLWEEETKGQTDTKMTYVQNIIEQLESHMAEERSSGLNAMAADTENEDIVKELLTASVLGKAASLLLDDSVMVRHSAAGALRNLSCVSGTACETMVSRGVMKPLVRLFKQKYGVDWIPNKGKTLTDGTFKTDSATEAFAEALHLLSNICAASEQALKTFNEEKLLQTLPRTLDLGRFGLRAAIAGARCLHTVTEENRDAIPNCADLVSLMLSTLTSDSEDKRADFLYLQTLVTGTIYNLLGSKMDGEILPVILKTLSKVLSCDEIKEINGFSSSVPLVDEGMEIGNDTSKEAANDLSLGQRLELDSTSTNILRLLDAETLALEILSNLVFVEDESSDGDFGNDSDDERMEEDCTVEKINLPAADFNVELSQGVQNEALVTKVLSKIKGVPHNVGDILENNCEFGGKEILDKLAHLRTVAMLCLQNLLQAFDLETLGENEELSEIYRTLIKILPSSLRGNLEFMEAITSALRATLQKVIDENCEAVVESFTAQDLEGLLTLSVMGATNDRLSTNLIRLVGSFGVLVARRKATAESRLEMLKIGEYLLGCLSIGGQTVDVIRTAEGLDTIFDVFAEDDFNDVVKELGLIDKLRNLAPHFKKQIRNRRRDLGESRGVVETARTNLSRFIDYKRGIGC